MARSEPRNVPLDPPAPASEGGRPRRDLEPEAALVEAVQGGDERAFGLLVERYTDEGYAVALGILRNPHDAEDALQNAFIRALEKIDHLRAGSPFGPWFYRVVRSTCLNYLRRQNLRSHGEIPPSAASGSDPEAETLRRMDREEILAALGELPEMQRTAVMLYDLEGYTHREIAEILDIAVGTSRAHVHHGRRSLRSRLGDGMWEAR